MRVIQPSGLTHGFPGLFTDTFEHILFSLFIFSLFQFFSCQFRAELTYVSR